MDRHLLAAYSRRIRGDHILLAQWSAGKDSITDWEVWGRGGGDNRSCFVALTDFR